MLVGTQTMTAGIWPFFGAEESPQLNLFCARTPETLRHPQKRDSDGWKSFMRINANVAGWFKLLGLGAVALYLWRSSILPGGREPRGRVDRTIRLLGAVLLTLVFVYFLGFGLGFWGSN